MNVLDKIEKINILNPKDGNIIFIQCKDGLTDDDNQEILEEIVNSIKKIFPDIQCSVYVSNSIELLEIIRKEK